MAFVQMLGTLVRDKAIGKHVVPIVPDESRTFGMEGMFRQLGIWSSLGQLYKPQDADQLMYYRESKDGQVLQEGINEGGAMSSWIVAATSYSTNNVPMIPFYIYYSMFGLQRVGDLAWLAGDIRARGFLLGGTAGRTTLNGEGLQHEDGHSHILAGTIPNCVSYDPTFAYEVVTIIRDGMRRMYAEQEDVYYYVTLMNENYPHPGMPEGSEAGILKGLYQLSDGGKTPRARRATRVQLMGSGTILREVMFAAELLKDDFGIAADVWSATSYNELRRDGMAAERWNRLHPTEPRAQEPCRSHASTATTARSSPPPTTCATTPTRCANTCRPPAGATSCSAPTASAAATTARKLRRFFEVDRWHVVVAALKALADDGAIKPAVVAEAIAKYGLDAERAAPWTV